jgi:hypothetical protein
MKETFIDYLSELIAHQKTKLLGMANLLYPELSLDDLLQPNDYPNLENNPLFRYEEGILAGLLLAQTALLAHTKDKEIRTNIS